jgi:hypothetical protein
MRSGTRRIPIHFTNSIERKWFALTPLIEGENCSLPPLAGVLIRIKGGFCPLRQNQRPFPHAVRRNKLLLIVAGKHDRLGSRDIELYLQCAYAHRPGLT